jgi:hypothetical protein
MDEDRETFTQQEIIFSDEEKADATFNENIAWWKLLVEANPNDAEFTIDIAFTLPDGYKNMIYRQYGTWPHTYLENESVTIGGKHFWTYIDPDDHLIQYDGDRY